MGGSKKPASQRQEEGGKRRGPKRPDEVADPKNGDNRPRPGKIEESADAARGVPAPPA
ncbi:hypothetical protein [Thermus scotoductus]|uniref:High mobility group protein HMG-I/HMG-Y n=1 Tax=Thermus scotoductus (strain ATCC 700910 / SA-01) TaxID=743525 RepID=E8PQI3_THESS|nr:hypothetical protein [Thermus scotoductus]ADW23022.1 high mobility group protein HMG-I/HMG-Y [Thermus scotoductus SA-01]